MDKETGRRTASRRSVLLRLAKSALFACAGGGIAYWGYKRQRPVAPPGAVSLAEFADRFYRKEGGSFPDLVIKKGNALSGDPSGESDPQVVESMIREALEALGGISRFVKRGGNVLLKPNAAFATHPRSGAITAPQTISAVIKCAKEAGAGEVLVTDNPISDPKLVFDRTGLREAVERAGGRVILPYSRGFRTVKTPGAEVLPPWPAFFGPFKRVDSIIGIATVKDHNLCTASLTMKNWYGFLGGHRNRFHQDIHSIICDLWRFIKPASPLLILDGTRILMRNGPTGGSPTDVVTGNTIAVGTDPVKVDAFGVSLLKRDPHQVGYLKKAEEAGFGELDYTKNSQQL